MLRVTTWWKSWKQFPLEKFKGFHWRAAVFERLVFSEAFEQRDHFYTVLNWPQFDSLSAQVSVPTASWVTSEPTATTIPLDSWPSTSGALTTNLPADPRCLFASIMGWKWKKKPVKVAVAPSLRNQKELWTDFQCIQQFDNQVFPAI